MTKVFISHARADRPFAEKLTKVLSAQNIETFSDTTLVAGARFEEQVRQQINMADLVILVLSGHTQKSEFIKAEQRAALSGGKRIVPILLDQGGRENLVWPLIADRQAIEIDSATDLTKLVETIARDPELTNPATRQ